MRNFLILLLLPTLVCAQEFPFQQEISGIPVTINGWQPFCPWLQGMSYSYPAFGDMDGDGDCDLLVGVLQNQLFSFLNAGTVQQAQFQWMQPQINLGPLDQSVEPTFCDLSGDSKPDLLLPTWTGVVRYYLNQSTPGNISFQLIEDSLTGNTQAWWLTTVDIDDDGLLELFSGSYFGTIKYFDNSGTPQNPSFSLITNNFAGIDVGYDSSPTFCDIDADGDYDLFIGDQNGRIWLYRNDGTPQNYNFTPVTSYWLSIDVGDMAAPTFCDIDGDGDYDLFIGREVTYTQQHMGDVFFYCNNGTAQVANFQYVTSNYLTADLGSGNNLQLVDIDGDGKLDLMAGASDEIRFFHNTGSTLSPSFNLEQEYYQNIHLDGIMPFFCDIDGDGDMDLFAGEGVIPGPPGLHLYLNRGTPQNPNYVLYSDNLVPGNFFVLIEPTLADIDGDGDLDLFITDQGNTHIFYYQNTGTPHWPNFQLITTNWQGISWPGAVQRHVRFCDIDSDGDLDLFLYNNWDELGGNNLRFYHNDGNAYTPNMTWITNNYLPVEIITACATFGDIDSDDHTDMFVGDGEGGILYFHGTGGSPVPGPKRPAPLEQIISVLPNQGNSGTTFSYTLSHPQEVSLEVYNLLGAKITTLVSGLQNAGEHTYIWNSSGRASGIYFVRLQTRDQIATRKLSVVK